MVAKSIAKTPKNAVMPFIFAYFCAGILGYIGGFRGIKQYKNLLRITKENFNGKIVG